ncbi:MAG: prepilin-type N-terminal cleavage/methylation domain-containing protein [Gallionella sp.]|nr:prepilin-type N-terminal cleavage/methylation domain-containing protein [Gallionella sp.]MDD4959953.1 prepilin-type N-terminal cleavage/methylation domain-containing protein [Gallionella sp.]
MHHVKNKGFTLVELMIVIAILGILAGIAIPGYTSYVARGRLIEAGINLSALRTSMEQYYQDQRTYAASGAAATCGVPVSSVQAVNFSYGCIVTGTGLTQGFTVTASSVVGVGLGAAATYVYSLDDGNVRRTQKFKGAIPAAGTGCFLIRDGQRC